MAGLPQMPNFADPEQPWQPQQACAAGLSAMTNELHGTLPGMSGLPGMPPSVPSAQHSMAADQAMAQAQAYMQMLAYLQQSMPQQGFLGAGGLPFMPFPGANPCPLPAVAPPEPSVRVSVEGMRFQYQLTEDDLRKVFGKYGRVLTVSVDEVCSSATVTFHSLQDAQAAISDLDGKVLSGLDGTLRVSWANTGSGAVAPPYSAMPAPLPGLGGLAQAAPVPCPPNPVAPLLPSSGLEADATTPGESRTLHVKGARKYTCRFLIGIENDKEFQVARRLIGSKGSNMKRIVKQTEAKLRLRGVGSGYFEGASQKESSEPLQLCVSCTSIEGYRTAVKQVKELIQGVYEEYRQFCRDTGQPVPDLQITLSGSGGNTGGGDSAPAVQHGDAGTALGGKGAPRKGSACGAKGGGKSGAGGGQVEPAPGTPSVEEIQRLISDRNEARRSCNFSEADRIRGLLHSRGVALMDEPGGRGKGAEVTTWRYCHE